MWLDLRRLRYFLAVAEELHFSRAAAHLHISQPSLSQQIGVLEAELGVELLRRDGGRVTLTSAGEALLREGRKTIDQAQRAVDAARRVGIAGGNLTVGFMGSAGRRLLPVVLRRFRERYPEAAVDVRELALSESNRAVLDGVIDLAFIRPFEADPRLQLHELPGDGLLAVVPEGHRLAAASAVTLDALAGEPFVRPTASSGLGPWLTFLYLMCDRHGFQPHFAAAEGSSLQSIVGLVAAGAGVSVMSSTTHTLPRDGVVAIPITDAVMPLALSRRADDQRPLTEAFALIVSEELEGHDRAPLS